MNWTTILTEEARENCILRTDELARKRQLSVPIVRNALRRYELRGLVERVSTKIYIKPFEPAVFAQRSRKHFAPKVLYLAGIGLSRERSDNAESFSTDLRDTRLSAIISQQVGEHHLPKDFC